MRVLDWFRKQAKWIEEWEDFHHLQMIVLNGMKKYYTGKNNMLDLDSVDIDIYEEFMGYPSGVQIDYDLYKIDNNGNKYFRHITKVYKFDFKKKYQDFYYRSACYPCAPLIRNYVADRVYACKTLSDLSKLNILDIIQVSKRVEPVAIDILMDTALDYDFERSVVGIVCIYKFVARWDDTFDKKYRIFKSYIFPIPFGQRLLMDIASHMDELLEHSYLVSRKQYLRHHTFRACSISGTIYTVKEDGMLCAY